MSWDEVERLAGCTSAVAEPPFGGMRTLLPQRPRARSWDRRERPPLPPAHQPWPRQLRRPQANDPKPHATGQGKGIPLIWLASFGGNPQGRRIISDPSQFDEDAAQVHGRAFP